MTDRKISFAEPFGSLNVRRIPDTSSEPEARHKFGACDVRWCELNDNEHATEVQPGGRFPDDVGRLHVRAAGTADAPVTVAVTRFERLDDGTQGDLQISVGAEHWSVAETCRAAAALMDAAKVALGMEAVSKTPGFKSNRSTEALTAAIESVLDVARTKGSR